MKRIALVAGLTVASALAAGDALAQFGALRGQVVDDDGQPVPEATVVVRTVTGQEITLKSKTNKKGSFSQVTAQTSGPWDVTVLKEGYVTWQTPQPIRVPLGGAPVSLPPISLTRVPPSRDEVLRGEFKDAAELLMAADAAQHAGDAATAAAKLAAAETALRGYLEKDPGNARAHFNIGLVHDRRQEWAEAAASYLKAAELEPGLVDASVGAGASLINAQEPARAVEVLESALAQDPDEPRLHSLMGLALYNEGRYAEATPHYEKVREARPDDPEANYYLGMIAVAENRAEDARALLEKYVSVAAPGDPNVKTAQSLLEAIRKRD